MEDKLNERLPLQKTTSKKDDLKVRQPQWTTLLEENLTEEDGRQNKEDRRQKTEDNFN